MIDLNGSENKRHSARYYYHYHKMLFNILIVSLILGTLVWGFNVFQVLNMPPPKNFLKTSDGKVVEIYTLSQPSYTNEAIVKWTASLVTRLNDVDITNYEKTLTNEQVNFSRSAWEKYKTIFDLTIKPSLEKGIKINSVVKSGYVDISGLDALTNTYKWKVILDVKTANITAKETKTTSNKVTIIVERQAKMTSDKGIQVVLMDTQ